MKAIAGLLALACTAPCANAQETAPPSAPSAPSALPASASTEAQAAAAPTPPTPPVLIPALTAVRIKVMAHINSSMNKIGEHFPIRLDAAIPLADGREVPAGIMGSGDVVHAAKSRFGGKAGELILAARYLDWDGVRIPLRSFSFSEPSRGKDNVDAAAATAIIVSPVLALFITGGEVNIPEGTTAYAKTSAAVTQSPTATTGALSTTSEQMLTCLHLA